jgi:hypothetical protein
MRSATGMAAVVGCLCAGCLDTKPDGQPSDSARSVWDVAGMGSDKPPLAPRTATGGRGALGASAASGSGNLASAQGSKTVPVAQAGRGGTTSLQPRAAGAFAAGSRSSMSVAGAAGEAAAAELPAEPGPKHAGDLVISELMIDPQALPDAQGEWFELYNASSTELSLRDCKLDDGVKTLHSIAQPLLLQAGEYATFARGPHPGFVPSATVALSLTNTADSLAIVCGGIEIDRVSYDKAAGFAIKSGATLSLDPDALSAQQNDDASAWCAGQNLYNDDFGTPGRANPSCHAEQADSKDSEHDNEQDQPDAGSEAGLDD